MHRTLRGILAFTLIAGCGDDPVDPEPPDSGPPPALSTHCGDELCLGLIAGDLDLPLQVTSPPDDDRVFVVEQGGRVVVLDGTERHTYIDISDDVLLRIENGLLGMAFHPDFASNGRFYLHYSDHGADNVLEELTVDPDANGAANAARRVVLRIEHDDASNNHKSGHLAFGPDGYLWISVGDGLMPPLAQDRSDLRGSILRIDVDAEQPYGIPADNPFVDDDAARPEIYHYGLRNPWRFSVDADLRMAFIPDVGNNQYEELNVVALDDGGRNFGWPIMEGPGCAYTTECDATGLTPPTLSFPHTDVPPPCALIGGFIYRGDDVPTLSGRYVFADACAGLRTATFDANGAITELSDWMFAELPGRGGTGIVSVGRGGDGAVYLAAYALGEVYRIEAP